MILIVGGEKQVCRVSVFPEDDPNARNDEEEPSAYFYEFGVDEFG